MKSVAFYRCEKCICNLINEKEIIRDLRLLILRFIHNRKNSKMFLLYGLQQITMLYPHILTCKVLIQLLNIFYTFDLLDELEIIRWYEENDNKIDDGEYINF